MKKLKRRIANRKNNILWVKTTLLSKGRTFGLLGLLNSERVELWQILTTDKIGEINHDREKAIREGRIDNNGTILKITDEMFFTLLAINPEYLAMPVSLSKIKCWQKDLKSQNNDTSFNKAEENLKKIGTTLAFKGWDKKGIDKELIYSFRNEAKKLLKEDQVLNCRNIANMNIKIKEILSNIRFTPSFWQQLENHIKIEKILQRSYTLSFKPQNYTELANIITAQYFSLSPSTVEKYIKKYKNPFPGLKKYIKDLYTKGVLPHAPPKPL